MAAASSASKRALWIVDFVTTEEELAEGENNTCVALQLCETLEEARARVRQLIDIDRAELAEMEAEEDAMEDASGDEQGESASDDAQQESESEGEGDSESDEFFNPPYPAVEEYGNYRITELRVGEFYGWHNVSA